MPVTAKSAFEWSPIQLKQCPELLDFICEYLNRIGVDATCDLDFRHVQLQLTASSCTSATTSPSHLVSQNATQNPQLNSKPSFFCFLTFEAMSVQNNAILVLSLSSAIIYGLRSRAAPSYFRMVAKTLSVALLSVLVVKNDGPTSLATALSFSATGDAFLAWDSEGAFLGGLANFLASHILYIALFIQAGRGWQLILSDGFRTLIALSMALLAPFMVVLLMPRVGRVLRVPVVFYSTAILGMVLSALTMDNNQIVLGAILFALSDTILASGKFLVSATSPHRSWMDYMVWVLYYSGQMLIAVGVLAVYD
ncbi:YhhN-like protein-domain-containing protein [Dactylonectria macrodidyma]|uniref:YhhN-like protein-domain-containing protein n=1 Tax=Dactylonectria macrodidyma TaxID=307937 RepID=A0A9P9JJ93_9HYPO|nr:YhhN-like protein-domain-containing protein [Dactylonectria macrodidyma]